MTGTFKGARQITCFITGNRFGYQANDKVTGGQFRQDLPETFAYTALDTVAVNRTRKQALGDNHAQTRAAHLVGAHHDHYKIGSRALIFGKNPIKVGFIDQPRVVEANASSLVRMRVD
jgi:hypothetical protein